MAVNLRKLGAWVTLSNSARLTFCGLRLDEILTCEEKGNDDNFQKCATLILYRQVMQQALNVVVWFRATTRTS